MSHKICSIIYFTSIFYVFILFIIMKFYYHPLIYFCVILSFLAIYALFSIDLSLKTGGINLSTKTVINAPHRNYDFDIANHNIVNRLDKQITINKSYSYPNVTKSIQIPYKYTPNSSSLDAKNERYINTNTLISSSTKYNIRHSKNNKYNIHMNNVTFNSIDMIAADHSNISMNSNDSPLTRLPAVDPDHPGAPIGNALILLFFTLPYLMFKTFKDNL